jgi:hypothetical protein
MMGEEKKRRGPIKDGAALVLMTASKGEGDLILS